MSKAELVKELRNLTNAGMSDCIKALNESGDSIEKAVEWLRKNGTVKAAKKANAIATEGVVKAFGNNKIVALIEINCQTDFVAKNEKFVDYVENVSKAVLDTKETDVQKVKINNVPINDVAMELTSTIGEKIITRRIEVLQANADQSLGHYTHMNNRIATAILVQGNGDETVLKNVCMHIAAMNPRYLDTNDVDSTWLNSEKQILAEQFKDELSKITNEKEKQQKELRSEAIIEGKIKKLLEEVCLLKQKFVMDNSITVEQYLANNNLKAIKMVNMILGDGIEKKESNFADEVAQQMKN